MIRFTLAPHRPITLLALLAALLFMTACITERTPHKGATASGASLRAKSAMPGPVAAPATAARSTNSAAKISLEPLGIIPYDGLVLPLVSPDGRYLATQTGEAPTWEVMLGEPGAAPPRSTSIEVYDLASMPATKVELQAPLSGELVLGFNADAAGFFLFRPGADANRKRVRLSYTTWETMERPEYEINDARAVKTEFELMQADFSKLSSREMTPADRYRLLASASLPPQSDPYHWDSCALAFDMSEGRMGIAFPEHSVLRENVLSSMANTDKVSPSGFVLPLASGSIAGCWAAMRQGPAVLLTTGDGLYLQQLSRSGPVWRAEAPVRLLREPYVPRATSNPERPYILIGPAAGTKDEPHRLQIVAMKIIEE